METREQQEAGPDEGAGETRSSPEALDADGAVAADAAVPTLPPTKGSIPTAKIYSNPMP